MDAFDSWRIAPDAAGVDLKAYDPTAKPLSQGSKALDQQRLAALGTQLDALQEKLYASQSRRVLLVLQGMDTSGKDGTIRAVLTTMNPLGLRIAAFKAPTAEEKARDYLWRVHAQVPRSGEIVVFNRSHYEDVLITRVHGWIDAAECARRYRQINDFERMLSETGTTLIKCFLHISKDEQKHRLEERLANPDKHWKFDPQDLAERKRWDDYQRAYAQALAATSTPHAPWFVIPADSKTHRNVMVAELLLRTLEGLGLAFPPANPAYAGLAVE